ncbi:dehydrogenase/reductase SDR family member 4-like isoform X2 [Ranitomeya imitator]|uniref:dehydrogenase/reductase SDR family member 4-like isoform X2 n=1 Tax=Ranitomeya imitator TaxID=111125 RepID=UPI0037E9589B
MHSEMKIKPCNESKKKLHEKVAIVTGSTYGIGFAIARRLAQDGAHVLICSRKKENVEKAAEQLKDEGLSIYAMQCHVGNKEDRERLVAKVFHVNVISTFFMIKLIAPHIEKQGGGSIILCSSFVGYVPHPTFGAYAISKTTLLGLTNILAQAMQHMNIRVNGLALGLINTSFSKVILETPELASIWDLLGVYRLGEPEECAGIASFLCSEDASYINGENIAVTGGMRGRL